LGPAYDPDPSKLAGEGVIQPTGGAVELAFGLLSELSYGLSVTEGSHRWFVGSGKGAGQGSRSSGGGRERLRRWKQGSAASVLWPQETADKGIPESGWVRDLEVSTPMRHGGSLHVAAIALRPAVCGAGCSTGPRHPGCCSADSARPLRHGPLSCLGPLVRRRGMGRPAAQRPRAAVPARRCGRRARRCRARCPRRPRNGPREARC
jgi:hypothetical protein